MPAIQAPLKYLNLSFYTLAPLTTTTTTKTTTTTTKPRRTPP
jgi:hypothetical protein